MNRIEKALAKLSKKERERAEAVLELIYVNLLESLDIKKLKGKKDFFRVRDGDIRIVFYKNIDGTNVLLTISRRNDTTYNF
jgi:mRNA-degrading endonuclease RelE of RelBE toxin-antitoxin system